MWKAKADFWRWFYSRWDQTQNEPASGYSVMILVPGDMPFFLKIALDVLATQNPEHLSEILIIPDNRLVPVFTEQMQKWIENYPIPVRQVHQKPIEKWFTQFHKNAHNNCWLQMVRGINAVRTRHALWHDVDLFVLEPNFLKNHYETCVAKGLSCLGVSKAWDSWFEEQGIYHIVGTWEAIYDVNWVRSFHPWQHRGHEELVNGKRHICDITFWPQYQTPPEQIGRHENEWEFIHFNYVTGTYRRFQNSRGSFEDERFILLLIRLLIDAYDPNGEVYEVPSLNELMQGIRNSNSRVTYCQPSTLEVYPAFRAKLQKLLQSSLLKPETVATLEAKLSLFEQALDRMESAPAVVTDISLCQSG
jgi:hypothetical protein